MSDRIDQYHSGSVALTADLSSYKADVCRVIEASVMRGHKTTLAEISKIDHQLSVVIRERLAVLVAEALDRLPITLIYSPAADSVTWLGQVYPAQAESAVARMILSASRIYAPDHVSHVTVEPIA